MQKAYIHFPITNKTILVIDVDDAVVKMGKEKNEYQDNGIEHVPIDLDIARTPKTRCPFHCITLPPAASILAYSSSRFGWKKKQD